MSYAYVFIGMSAHTYMNICVCTVFQKKFLINPTCSSFGLTAHFLTFFFLGAFCTWQYEYPFQVCSLFRQEPSARLLKEETSILVHKPLAMNTLSPRINFALSLSLSLACWGCYRATTPDLHYMQLLIKYPLCY
jgi:hypothetical protein